MTNHQMKFFIILAIVILLMFGLSGRKETPDFKGNIYFISNQMGYENIFRIDANGENLVQITNEDNSIFEGLDVSNDGKIIYSHLPADIDRAENPWELYIMDTDGNNIVRLTNNNISEGRKPRFSPDDSKIAFTRFNATGGRSSDIFIMDVDGKNEMKVTSLGEIGYAKNPDWSPDGSKITFVGKNDTYCGLFIIDTDGNNMQKIVSCEQSRYSSIASPRWSPNENKILFIYQIERTYELREVDLDSLNVKIISRKFRSTNSPRGKQIESSYSPDGNHIIFATYVIERDKYPPKIIILDTNEDFYEIYELKSTKDLSSPYINSPVWII